MLNCAYGAVHILEPRHDGSMDQMIMDNDMWIMVDNDGYRNNCISPAPTSGHPHVFYGENIQPQIRCRHIHIYVYEIIFIMYVFLIFILYILYII